MKIFNSHIFRSSAALVTLFISGMLSEAHATTTEGEKKNSKQQEQENPKRGGNSEMSLEGNSENVEDETVEAETAVPVVESYRPVAEPSKPSAESSNYQPSYLDSESSSTGEDQNAVLSFNVIQYMFQRFKFSEEAY